MIIPLLIIVHIAYILLIPTRSLHGLPIPNLQIWSIILVIPIFFIFLSEVIKVNRIGEVKNHNSIRFIQIYFSIFLFAILYSLFPIIGVTTTIYSSIVQSILVLIFSLYIIYTMRFFIEYGDVHSNDIQSNLTKSQSNMNFGKSIFSKAKYVFKLNIANFIHTASKNKKYILILLAVIHFWNSIILLSRSSGLLIVTYYTQFIFEIFLLLFILLEVIRTYKQKLITIISFSSLIIGVILGIIIVGLDNLSNTIIRTTFSQLFGLSLPSFSIISTDQFFIFHVMLIVFLVVKYLISKEYYLLLFIFTGFGLTILPIFALKIPLISIIVLKEIDKEKPLHFSIISFFDEINESEGI
jgi:hypothetical protein